MDGKAIIKRKRLPDASLRATWSAVRKNEGLAFGLVIILLFIVRAIVLALGFVSVAADEYARTLYAANWAKSPYIFGETPIWLPVHFHILGLGLKAHYDLFLTPRIVTMIFSFASLGMLYLLARKLFNRWTALLSILIAGLSNIHVYLSLTPMAEVFYLTFLLGFLYFFFTWLDKNADRHLLIAAFMLALATGVRYESWFTAAVFCFYLGLRWLMGLWKTRSLRPIWLLAIGLVCLIPSAWILRNYILWDDPLHFTRLHTTSASGAGPLSDLFLKLAHIELLFQNWTLICLLAVVGITLSYRFLAHKIWLYLAFSLTPLVIVSLLVDGLGRAFRPRYIIYYLIPLTPFCAYTIYWVIAAHKQSFHYRWQTRGWGMLVMMSLYNLWLVYLRFTGHSWMLVGLLAVAGIALSPLLLSRKHWFYLTSSLIPLPILIVISRSGFVPGSPRLCMGLYFIILALFYAYNVWQAIGVLKPPSRYQWRIAGLSMLAIICLYNLWGTFFRIPEGMPASVNEAGWLVRKLFEEGALAENDKVLIEVADFNYLGMLVMSNHPKNFILDRSIARESKVGQRSFIVAESFLIDKSSFPYAVRTSFTTYEARANPFSLDPPADLDEYLRESQIRLVIVKDPRLKALLNQQTEFERIDRVADYAFYYAAD